MKKRNENEILKVIERASWVEEKKTHNNHMENTKCIKINDQQANQENDVKNKSIKFKQK